MHAADYEQWRVIAWVAGLSDGVQKRKYLRSCFGFGVIVTVGFGALLVEVATLG